MPKPPILPVIDWKSIFDSGKDYPAWLAAAESADQRARMEAGLKNLSLPAPLAGLLRALPRPVHVIAIAEDWCGDVVRHVPALQKLAAAGPNLKVRYISREQHPQVFIRFLTNGGEAIPKFIFVSEAWVECGNWGPMPAACRELIARGKACGDVAAARQKVKLLCEADPNQDQAVRELAALVEIAANDRV